MYLNSYLDIFKALQHVDQTTSASVLRVEMETVELQLYRYSALGDGLGGSFPLPPNSVKDDFQVSLMIYLV